MTTAQEVPFTQARKERPARAGLEKIAGHCKRIVRTLRLLRWALNSFSTGRRLVGRAQEEARGSSRAVAATELPEIAHPILPRSATRVADDHGDGRVRRRLVHLALGQIAQIGDGR